VITFAIGDIHGRLDKLNLLFGTCGRYFDAKTDDEDPPTFIYLGDVIDRGPDSANVINFILSLRYRFKRQRSHRHGKPRMDIPELSGPGNGEIAEFRAKHSGIEGHVRSYYSRLVPFHDDGLRFFMHAGVECNVRALKQTTAYSAITQLRPSCFAR
jgi:hypothetical protein